MDIGLHNDGLVHKSQMANYYVSSPIEVVSVGEKVKVRVLDIDEEREKVSLSMKEDSRKKTLDSRKNPHPTGVRHIETRRDQAYPPL